MWTVIRISRESLSFDKQFEAGFYGEKGWGKEPITSSLGVEGQTIGQIFPHPVSELCLTAYLDNLKPVGHCNANRWSDFLEKLPCNLHALRHLEHPGTQKFIALLRQVVVEEWVGLRPFLLSQGLKMDEIAHCCGLMIMMDGKGFATALVSESDKLLKESGYKASVVETTNIASRRVFEKNGYTVFKAFDLANFGIDLKDQYTILYKIL